MISRILLALALIIGLSVPAYAVEINTDVGCDTSGAWMPETGWSVTGSKCVASSATRMKMLMQMNSAIKKNHIVKITFTVSGVSGSGKLRAFAGVTMPSAPTGSYITAASVSSVADNFTTSLGLQTAGKTVVLNGPGDEGDRNGSMRLTCVSGGFKRVDPMVYPNLQAPHLHELVGASNMEENWTYTDFRTKAQSSCTNMLDPTHTINRSGYWYPALINGVGDAVRTNPTLIYYKTAAAATTPASVNITASISGTTLTVTSAGAGTVGTGLYVTGTGVTAGTVITARGTGTGGTGTYTVNNSQTVSSSTLTLKSPYLYLTPTEAAANPVATMCADQSYAGVCSNVPRGLRFTGGYKGSFNAITTNDNNCGPADTVSVGDATTERCSIRGRSGQWSCSGGPNGEGAASGVEYAGPFNTLQDMKDSGLCVVGSVAKRALTFQTCWDNVNVDSPDHRSHMGWSNPSIKCLSGHPVLVTAISLLVSYPIDSTLSGWHLSSDEMAACYDTGNIAGCTEHFDYWEAWSDSVRDAWYQNGDLAHNSLTNEIGDGTSLKYPTTNIDGTPIGQIFQNPRQMNSFERAENFGMSRDITANGTYTVYLRSVGDGVWGFMGMKNFSGSIDSISVTDMGAAAKGPVTVNGGGMAANDNENGQELALAAPIHFDLKTGSLR